MICLITGKAIKLVNNYKYSRLCIYLMLDVSGEATSSQRKTTSPNHNFSNDNPDETKPVISVDQTVREWIARNGEEISPTAIRHLLSIVVIKGKMSSDGLMKEMEKSSMENFASSGLKSIEKFNDKFSSSVEANYSKRQRQEDVNSDQVSNNKASKQQNNIGQLKTKQTNYKCQICDQYVYHERTVIER